MKANLNTYSMRILLSVLLIVSILGVMFPLQGKCAANDEETIVLDEMADIKESALRPRATFNIVSITEGIKDYPLQRQLTNPIPFDSDFTIILAVGFTGDKLDIKITDEGGLGDRLMGIALAFYSNLVMPSWGSVYSTSSGNSFTITIPVSQPGVIVWLYSGYQRQSLGENPYQYTVELSFPQ